MALVDRKIAPSADILKSSGRLIESFARWVGMCPDCDPISAADLGPRLPIHSYRAPIGPKPLPPRRPRLGERWKLPPPDEAEIRALPARVHLVDAARALCLGREKAQAMAAAGSFPVRVVKIGRSYFVNKSDLLAELGMSRPVQSA